MIPHKYRPFTTRDGSSACAECHGIKDSEGHLAWESMQDERNRLGKLVRNLWISWAERQPNPKPSWLVPYEELSEADKEADRVIGEGLMHEFFAETTGERMQHDRLKQIALRLRDELHGFRELYAENDPTSGKAIEDFDDLVGTEAIADGQ